MPEQPSLTAAIRFSVSGLIEWVHAFVLWNLALVVAVAVVLTLLLLTNLALLLVPLLAPLVCGLLRLATVAHRDEVVTLRTAVPGIRHRWRAKVGLAAAQSLILLLAALNVMLAPAIGGPFAALSVGTSVYLALAVAGYAMVGWTLLCDPRRESQPIRQLARLALVVLVRRPLAILFFLVVTALAVVIVSNLVVPALFLPSMILLLVARYVLPAADLLVPVEDR